MPKQGENSLWDYFKISNEVVSKAVCILCKKNLSRKTKDPHKITTTTSFGTSLVICEATLTTCACSTAYALKATKVDHFKLSFI